MDIDDIGELCIIITLIIACIGAILIAMRYVFEII